MADQLSSIVEPGQAQRLATGFGFTEGPLWHPDGYWLYADIPANIIHRLTPGGQPEVFRDNSSGSNGITFDLNGNLIVCEGTTRQMTRREADGSYTPIATHIDGKRINRPNDVVVRSDGTIYFTDPAHSFTAEDPQELDSAGVHRINTDGTHSIAASNIPFPNGLAFSPDERTLYVDNTFAGFDCVKDKEGGEVCEHQYILAFDVAPDGALSNQRVFATMYSAVDGVPDGLKVDVEGRVYCTGAGGCWVFNAAGTHLGTIELPEVPANNAWGGPDNRTMFFTARTSVYTLQMKTPGTAIHRS
jgi:sugar lactone lactonase YvrE